MNRPGREAVTSSFKLKVNYNSPSSIFQKEFNQFPRKQATNMSGINANFGSSGKLNPICESCEEDRKNSEKLGQLMEDEPCADIYKTVANCMKTKQNQSSACVNEWKEFAMCQKSNNKYTGKMPEKTQIK